MMIQKDDRNLVLTLSAEEAGMLLQLGQALSTAAMVGVVSMNDEEISLVASIVSAPFQVYGDAELIDAIMAPHADHPGDDLVAMRELYEEIIPEKRLRYVEEGFIPAALIG